MQASSRTAPALALLAAATVAFGLIAEAAGLVLGTPSPPFFMVWDPQPLLDALPWVAIVVLAAAAATTLAHGQRQLRPTALFLLVTTALALAARLALAAVRDGTDSWYAVFGLDPEAANEYLPALPALDLGTVTFLDRYAEIAPSLPIHPSAHPPGMLLLLDWLGIATPQGAAVLVIAAGVLVVPLTYLAARRLGFEEGRARIATLLCAFSPALMLYGVSSADALFATLGLLATLLLVAGGIASRIAGALALAVASFFSWALLAMGTFAAIVVALREGSRKSVLIAAGAALALILFYGSLHAITGYDPIGVLAAASDVYALGISNARPWAFWVFGSPVAFFVVLGLPISWYAARALGGGVDLAIGLAAIVVVAALLGFSKAETERIWLFMAPLACLAAARVMPAEKLPPVLAFLVLQALSTELLLETIW